MDDLEVGGQELALPGGRPNVVASVVIEEERLNAAGSIRVEVEDDETTPHHASKGSEHAVRDVVGQVVQDAGHDGLVELGVAWKLLEEHPLEAGDRNGPTASVRSRDSRTRD